MLINGVQVLHLPRVTAPVLWIHGYYDGPLSGTVMYDGRICWFETNDDPSLPKRRYFLYDLEDWELVRIITQHFQFEMYVGTHYCDHSRGPVKPLEMHRQFYDNKGPSLGVTVGKRPFAKFIMNKKKEE